MEIVGLLQLSISQFIPNTFSLFYAYCVRIEDINMLVTAKGFLSVFVVKRRIKEHLFYFQGVAQCKFTEHGSRWTGFEKRSFYLRGNDWAVPFIAFVVFFDRKRGNTLSCPIFRLWRVG